MADKTKIEWTDSTWSPLRVRVKMDAPSIAKAKGYTSLVQIAMKMRGHIGPHCEHVSPGCLNCYAGTNNHRCLPANGTGLPYDRRSRDLVKAFVDGKALMAPFKWRGVRLPGMAGFRALKSGAVAGAPQLRSRRIFVENQSDLFGEWYTDEMIDEVFAVMALNPQHVFQVLTKRPQRMLDYFLEFGLSQKGGMQAALREAFIGRAAMDIHLARSGDPPLEWSGLPLPNVWLGVSAESQAAADERIPILLQIPAAVRFVSAEPLLGPIDFRQVPGFNHIGIDVSNWWVIAGGESGPGARPCRDEWIRSIVEQCAAARVPCFVKQMGSHVIQGGVSSRKKHRKGGDKSEWPHEIRVQQFPEGANGRGA